MAKAKRKEVRNIRSLVNAIKSRETGLFSYQGLSVQIGHTCTVQQIVSPLMT